MNEQNETKNAFDTPLTLLEKSSEELLSSAKETESYMQSYYEELAENADEIDDSEVQKKIDALRNISSNITKSGLVSLSLEDELRSRWYDVRKSKNRRIVSAAPANTVIDYKENKLKHFAQGRNFYKLALIFVIGSFVGVVIELLWCLITNGYLESRSGLVYGPFNMLYGVGAVALTLSLYQFRNHSRWISFFGGFIIGSIIEYLCSFFQELLFNSRSWDYSDMPFNINGRICLLYSIFWGILGVLWIKNLYPRMAEWILKIPNKIGIVVTWVMIVFFIFDGAVSYTAIYRWNQRINGIDAGNSFWEFVDERFPDERMQRIYANMVFGNEEESNAENAVGEDVIMGGETE